MLRAPLNFPRTYQSLIQNNEQFCEFLANLDYTEIQSRYRKLLVQYEIKKDYQNDLLKIKKELESKKFFASSNGDALLHLMTISKNLSKMTLELIPQASTISTIQNYIYDLIDAVFGTKNADPNEFEVSNYVKDQYIDLLGKYQPLYVIYENMNQLVQDTIKNEGDIRTFKSDYSNLLRNLEKQIIECDNKLKNIQNDMEAIRQLKESIEKYRNKNCSKNSEIKLAST